MFFLMGVTRFDSEEICRRGHAEVARRPLKTPCKKLNADKPVSVEPRVEITPVVPMMALPFAA